jgi:TolB-like protein
VKEKQQAVRRTETTVGAALLFFLTACPPAFAQCPDGTPPPCAAARRAAPARVAVPTPADRARRFLVLPFRNVTRAAEQEWMVEGSTTMLNDALSRWQEIRVVPDDRLYPALRRAGITPGAVAEPAVVRRVAEATGGWTAVTGEILATGGRVRVTARATDVVTSRELARASSEVAQTADVRAAFDTIGVALLRTAGLAGVTIDLRAATTSSLEAYRAYLRGMGHFHRSEVRRAQAAFREAVALDSGFALAWARLSEVTFAVSPENFFDPAGSAVAYLTRAHALSAELPLKNRRIIQAMHAMMGGRIGESRRILESALAEDSLDVEAMAQLSSVLAMDPLLVPVAGGRRPRGSWNGALALSKRLLELDPARHGEYNTMVALYSSAAGWPPGIAVGRPREYGSFAEMVRAQPERLYLPLLRDTIVLVPLESLATVPRDTILASRARARVAARLWADRWITASPAEGAAWQAMARVRELDGDFTGALAALARADSLGVEQGFETVPVRRLVLSMKAGRLAAAQHINDSLWSARWFDTTTVLLTGATEAVHWSFAINLLGDSVARNARLLERFGTELRRFGLSDAVAEGRAFEVMVGNPYTWLDPPLSPALLTQVLDSILTRPLRIARSPLLGRWMPLLLNRIAGTPGLDRAAAANRLVLTALLLADSGLPDIAWQLASNALVLDSTPARDLPSRSWYRQRSEELEFVRRGIQRRFRAGAAEVTATEAVFEWRVDGDSVFPLFRAVVPPGRGEYRWWVEAERAGHLTGITIAVNPRLPGNEPRAVPLATLLNIAGARAVLTGPDSSRLAPLPAVPVRTEVVAGGFRMIVRDSATVAWFRAARPEQARFQFFPCYHDPAPPHREECVDQRVAIIYR